MQKVLVYTAVLGGYDRVLPPGWQQDNVEFRLLTDDPAVSVPGWHTVVVPKSPKPSEANRRLKFLYEVGNTNFDFLVYVDGNLGIWRSLDSLLQEVSHSESTVGLFRHPQRSSASEELDACLALGKISEKEFLDESLELEAKLESWQNLPVWDASCIVKNNTDRTLAPLMTVWHEFYSINKTRDQLWLGAAIHFSRAKVHEFRHYSQLSPPPIVRHPHIGRLNPLSRLYLALAKIALTLKMSLKSFDRR